MKFIAFALLFGLVYTSPLVIKDSAVVRREWTRVARAPNDHIIELRVALKQDKFGKKSIWGTWGQLG
jgi:hypothetical protein